MGVRRFVPMEALWSMPVDVPVSLLLQDDDLAWSCGQLALDQAGAVLHENDLSEQSRTVCDYIDLIRTRADLAPTSLRRVLLYHVPASAEAVADMLGQFRERFGGAVLLDPIAVPHFYYPGVLLECDAFFDAGQCESTDRGAIGVRMGSELAFVSVDAAAGLTPALAELQTALAAAGLEADACLSEHWYAPRSSIDDARRTLTASGWTSGGHVIETTGASPAWGVLVFARTALDQNSTAEDDGTVLTVRRAGTTTWVHGRSTDVDAGLVAQTEQIMDRIAGLLPSLGLSFDDSAKCTAHYVGDDSPETLHGNLAVRNRHYAGSGLASTGLPVAGFADDRSRISVDLTFRS